MHPATRRCSVLVVGSRLPSAERLERIVSRLADVANLALALGPGKGRHEEITKFNRVHAIGADNGGHGPAFRRAFRRADPEERFAVLAAHDAWLIAELERVEVVLALDPRAKCAMERLAAEHADFAVVDTAAQARRVIQRQSGESSGQAADRPPARPRRSSTPAEEVRRLIRGGNLGQAEAIALGRLGSDAAHLRERADLLGEVAHASLGAGEPPGCLIEAAAAELAVADAALARQQIAEAAEAADEALTTAFHRVAHLDGLRSPLAAEPTTFSEPLRESRVLDRVRGSRGRSGGSRRRPAVQRVLLATWANANFLPELEHYLDSEADIETRYVDFHKLDVFDGFRPHPRRLVEEVLSEGPGKLTALVEDSMRPHLDWADVVFIDWFTVVPALLTLIDPQDTRIVVRLHSVEAFTFWPQLVDFSRIDDLVFVSEHLKDLTVASVPGLSEPDAPRLHVIPLALELESFDLPKDGPEVRFNLGLIGWSAVAKDPLWALEIIKSLRSLDPRYRLLLFGSDFSDRASKAASRYGDRLWPLLEQLEAEGAVERRGHTDDVPRALQDVGVILSSSVREGCHTAVIEGAASGSVPVVRDWPFFAGKPNGASTLYPPDWVVASVDDAVARVLALTADEAEWRRAGMLAKRDAFERWGWERVKPLYDRLLLGRRSSVDSPP